MNKNLFGTDGIRAKVGEFPLDLDSLVLLGQAIGLWAQKKYKKDIAAAIGSDTRESEDFVKNALCTGLLAQGCSMFNIETVPTPGVFIFTREEKANFGIVVSASHNLYQYNGIKIFDRKKGKISEKDEQEISKFFWELQTKKATPKYSNLGVKLYPDYSSNDIYFHKLVHRFRRCFLLEKKVVLDCANGTTSSMAPAIFHVFGADVICLHNKPDGKNINQNCGSTHPESLQKAVLKHKADIGFAFDGDGDRVIAVNRHGKLKNGDDILALLAMHPKYEKENAVVGTIMSNCGLEPFLETQNKRLIRTPVGDKHVVHALKKNKLSLGAEPSGHVVCGDYLYTGDGIFAALRIAEVAKHTNNWDLKTFEKYPQVNVTIPVTEKKDLSSGSLAEIIQETQADLPTGRTVVRYSGTEPILRIMVEEKTEKTAQVVCATLVKRLQRELG